MFKNKPKSAWIIEWSIFSNHLNFPESQPLILPSRWGKQKIKDFLRVLYFNSPLYCLPEVKTNVDQGFSGAVSIRDSGRRIDYSGDGVVLTATHVNDLRFSLTKDGDEVMEWTLTPHLSTNPNTGRTIEITKKVKRKYVKLSKFS